MSAELFRLVWTREGVTKAGEPTTREDALAQFDNCPKIQRACSLGQGHLRVISDKDFQASRAAS